MTWPRRPSSTAQTRAGQLHVGSHFIANNVVEKVGTLSSAKLNEVENLILMGDQVSIQHWRYSGVIALGRGVHR